MSCLFPARGRQRLVFCAVFGKPWLMASEAAEWTIVRLLDWTKDYFVRAHLEEPRLCAEVLLAHVLGCPRLGLYTQFSRQPAPEQLETFRQLIKQAAGGQPIAYIVGQREFYSLPFRVTPDVLIPRPETELLVDAVLEVAKAATGTVHHWDLCTGSGCVAIASAHYAANLKVLATDISEKALAVAAENAAANHVTDRVSFAQADLLSLPPVAADWPAFDVITANPPYVSQAQMKDLPKVVLAEPVLALEAGATGLECIEPIVRDAAKFLRPGGKLAIEMGMGQAGPVYQLLQNAGSYQDIRMVKDAAGIERTAVAFRAT